MENIKGWAASTLQDIKGVSLLLRWFCSDPKHRFLPEFNFLDAKPTFDGCLRFGVFQETKTIPEGTIDVQIKSISSDYQNENAKANISDYKYSCKTEILNAVESGLTRNPAILFVVDTINERLFAIPLTREYLQDYDFKDKTSVVLYFNKNNQLSSYDDFFKLTQMLYTQRAEEYERLNKHGLFTLDELPKEKLGELQDIADYVEETCKTTLGFLKKWSFPDIWKVGLAYYQEESTYTVGLILIEKGTDDALVLRSFSIMPGEKNSIFDRRHFEIDNNSHFVAIRKNSYPLADAVSELLDDWLKTYLETYIIPPKIMSKTMLEEFSFLYLDKLAGFVPSLSEANKGIKFYKDTLSIQELKLLYNSLYSAYEKQWLTILEYSSGDINHEGIYVVESPLMNVSENNTKSLVKNVESFYAAESTPPRKLILEYRKAEIPFPIIEAVIDELQVRNEEAVRRPWKIAAWKEFEAQFKEPENIVLAPDHRCLINEYIENYSKLADECSSAYPDLCKSFFGKQSCELYFLKERHEVNFYFDDKDFFGSEKKSISSTEFTFYEVDFSMKVIGLHDQETDILEPEEENLLYIQKVRYGHPKFYASLPLYSMVEELLVRGMKGVHACLDKERSLLRRQEMKRRETLAHLYRTSVNTR